MNSDPHLRQFYDRWDRLEQEKAATQADLRELFAELKSAGFNPKVARAAFRHRAQAEDDPSGVAQFDSELELYLAALDSGGPRTLARASAPAPAHAPAREEPPHDPETGEVQETEPGEGRAAASVPASPAAPSVPSAGGASDQMPDIPEALRRTRAA